MLRPFAFVGVTMRPDRVLDPEVLTNLLSLGGEEFVREIFADFRTESARRLEAIAAGLTARDGTAIARAAHAPVSSAGNVGAAELSGTARHLERAALSGEWEEVDLLAGRLREGYEAVSGAMASWPPSPPAG